ncbi:MULTISPECIES: hypothetical protein [unclassified Isoptericola]|uniref:hypothetical protein n=1 Tax=unclassified Isoptericola TaxID=2623355 RepID=UPI0037AB7E4F|nr:hypothetical protein [Isoptericola sp. QY 916]
MSPAELDERLARLAPTASPDPERLDAARAALDAAVDGTGPTRSRRVGDAHVLDLDHARSSRHDDADGDFPLPLVDDDVVVPLRRGRTAREHRRRRVQLGAAAAGVVGVVAVGLVLTPRPAPGPASPEESCAANLTASVVPEGLVADLRWQTIAYQSDESSDVTLLRTDGGELSGFCAESRGHGGTTSTMGSWPAGPDDPPGRDEILPAGTNVDPYGWSVLWGTTGGDVRSVDLHAEWDESVDRSFREENGLGMLTEARLNDGFWSVFLAPGEIPEGASITLTWHLADGTSRSAPLLSAWDARGDFAGQRRTACVPGWRGYETVVDDRRGDYGVTMAADRASGALTSCVQEAEAPYTPLVTSGSTLPEDRPAPDWAFAVSGSAGGVGAQLVGLAGEDVARVEVRTADGTRLVAPVTDGYWVAWSADLVDPTTAGEADEGPWDGATMTWYDADDEPLGDAPVFP